MGAKVLGQALQGHAGIEILPANAVAAAPFLQGLDCFTYRTHPCFPEAWGRVVLEAMAAGLPVVVRGGWLCRGHPARAQRFSLSQRCRSI